MSENLRQEIISMSYRMFKEQGYDNVKISDICTELGISKPTFYNYVKSKDELLQIFYSDIEAKISKELLGIIAQDNYWKQILCAFQIILSHSQEFGQDLYSQLFIANLKENHGTFEFQEGITNLMVALIKKAQAAKQILNKKDPYDIYIACAHLSIGYGVVWCLGNGNDDLLKNFEKGLIQLLDVNPKYI